MGTRENVGVGAAESEGMSANVRMCVRVDLCVAVSIGVSVVLHSCTQVGLSAVVSARVSSGKGTGMGENCGATSDKSMAFVRKCRNDRKCGNKMECCCEYSLACICER